MTEIYMHKLKQCRECITLGAEHVPADGSVIANIMFIGQSPGQQEVSEQLPFVGPCGELLTFLLDEIGITRDQVYITNALKCHPPGNRPAHEDELANCYSKWLKKEIKVVNPKLVVLLGKDAWKSVTKGKIPFEHGKITKRKTRFYMTVYHPGYFLRKGDIESFIQVGKLIKETIYDQS